MIQGGLSNWELRYPKGPNGWKVEDEILGNSPPSVDLMTTDKYTNFTLHAEFRIHEGATAAST